MSAITDEAEAPAKYGYAQIRDAITERLGGPFDYTSFTSELREITSELPKLEREFKLASDKFVVPDLKDGFEKVPPFKFTLPEFSNSSIFTVDPIFGGQQPGASGKAAGGVSYQKAAHLASIHSEPQYLVDCDLKQLEREAAGQNSQPARQPEIYRPQTSPVPSAPTF